MRSDFYGLPYDAQQAIRRGYRDAALARGRARSVGELQSRVEELEAALTKCLGRLTAHPDRTTLDIEAIELASNALSAHGAIHD